MNQYAIRMPSGETRASNGPRATIQSPPTARIGAPITPPSPRRRTKLEAVDILTGFSPDGRFIAFTSDRDGELGCGFEGAERCPDVFVKRARLSAPAFNLTRSPAIADFDPVWQPRDRDHHGHGGHH